MPRYNAQMVQWEFEEPSFWLSWLPESVLQLNEGHLFKRVIRIEIVPAYEERIPRSLQKHLYQLPYLEEIRFQNAEVDNQDLEWLGRVPKLKRIMFDNCRWLDSAPLQLPSKMQALVIEDCSDIDLMIASVGSHRRIKHVQISFCPIHVETLDVISGCQSLKDLTIRHYSAVPIAADGFKRLRNLPNLQSLELDLPNNSISTEAIFAFSQFRNLNSLVFPTRGLDDSALAHLSSLRRLEQIGFTNDPDSTDFFIGISSLKHLKAVKIGCLDQPSLRHLVASLKSVPSLQWIDHCNSRILLLGNDRCSCKLPLAGLIELAKLPKFLGVQKHVVPAESDFNRETLTRLGGRAGRDAMPTRLLCGSVYDVSGQWKHAALLQGLKQLSLQNTDITDEDLRDIVRIESLNSLDLSNTRLTNEGIQSLASLKNLQELSILGFPLSPTIAQSLSTLTRIKVGGCELSQETLHEIALLPNIICIEMEGTLITEAGAQSLMQSQSLAKLILKDCYASKATMDLLNGPSFTPALECTSMTEFPPTVNDEPANDIVSKNAPTTVVAQDLDTPGKEFVLDEYFDPAFDFERMQIRDEQFQLHWLSESRKLRIRNKPVTDKAVGIVSQAVRIQELDISGTKISNHGLARLVKLPDLDNLAIGGPLVNSESIALIVEMGDRLRSLKIENASLTRVDLKSLNSLVRLDSLCLTETNLTVGEVLETLNLPRLQHLDVDGISIYRNDLLVHRSNRVEATVSELWLEPHTWTAERMEVLRGHPGITMLTVKVGVDLRSLLEVASTMPKLRRLMFLNNINHFMNPFKKVELTELPEQLPTVPQLTSLSLPEVMVTPELLDWIGRHEAIESLVLDGSVFKTQDLSPLNRLKQLQWLNLNNCGLEDEAISSLETKQLKSLDLGLNKLTDASIPAILAIGHSTKLSVESNRITPSEVVRLRLERKWKIAQ